MKQPQPPAALKSFQRAFSQSIRTPFAWRGQHHDYRWKEFAPEMVAAVSEGPSLGTPTRLTTYNQQYWYRLFKTAQNMFPLLKHVLTARNLNQLISDYAAKYPSTHPNLAHFADKLPEFLEEDVPWNTPLNREIVTYELYLEKAFTMEESRHIDVGTLTPETIAETVSRPLAFQPTFRLWQEHWNIVACRRKLKKGIPLGETLQPEKKTGLWALFRSKNTQFSYPLVPAQYRLLTYLNNGLVLEEACNRTAEELDPNSLQEFGQGLQPWMQEWVGLGWFCSPDTP